MTDDTRPAVSGACAGRGPAWHHRWMWQRRIKWWLRDHVQLPIVTFVYWRLPDSGHGETFKPKLYLFREALWSIICGWSVGEAFRSSWRIWRKNHG